MASATTDLFAAIVAEAAAADQGGLAAPSIDPSVNDAAAAELPGIASILGCDSVELNTLVQARKSEVPAPGPFSSIVRDLVFDHPFFQDA